ncbi:hypothetical protein OG589_20140 [Sphaerisporangium sp. NBC_01403]|uniref:hypothetical protein n=1 Tax=Sphaerisporangium sp. NBC_01403 TaxID=2903599 RepID=UPI00325382E6
MELNKQVAGGIAEEYLARWRRVALYDELALMEQNGDKDYENVIGEDGQEYKVLFYALPGADGALRMVVAVNHRRLRSAVAPLTREAIIRSDGSYVE